MLQPKAMTEEETLRAYELLFIERTTAVAETLFRSAGLQIKKQCHAPQNSWRMETPITGPSDASRGVSCIMTRVHEKGGITKAYNCYVLITGDPQNVGFKIGAYFV